MSPDWRKYLMKFEIFANLNSNLQLNHNLVFWINCWSSLSSNVFPGIKTSIEPNSHFFVHRRTKRDFRVFILMESYFDPLSGVLDPNLEWIKNGKNSGSNSRKEILNGLLATGLIHSKRFISIFIHLNKFHYGWLKIYHVRDRNE